MKSGILSLVFLLMGPVALAWPMHASKGSPADKDADIEAICKNGLEGSYVGPIAPYKKNRLGLA